MKESEFDKNVVYTLRIELLSGKVLIYPIDTENKQYLIDKLRMNSEEGEDSDRLSFLWFETFPNRQAIINISSIARIIFCFDAAAIVVNHKAYRDNFDVLGKKKIEEGEVKIDENNTEPLESEGEYLPQAIIYHKGKDPDDHYQKNPLLYSSLDEGCLATFDLELEGDLPFRQFINLIDEDGEETFIPLEQIILMEFDSNLMYVEEETDEEEA